MTWPTDIQFNKATLTSITPTIRNRSLSGIETRSQLANQRYDLQGEFQNLNTDDRIKLFSFLVSQGGSLNSFAVPLPYPLADNSEGYTGSITVASGANAGATSVSVSGTGTADVLKAGDLVVFSSHSKVYMATSDFSLSSGSGTLNIFPALAQAVQSTNTIDINDIEMTVRLANDEIVEALNNDSYSSFNILFNEVVV